MSYLEAYGVSSSTKSIITPKERDGGAAEGQTPDAPYDRFDEAMGWLVFWAVRA